MSSTAHADQLREHQEDVGGGSEDASPGKARPFDSERAREAAKRRWDRERERKREQEAAADWNALTVEQRLAHVMAKEATVERWTGLVTALFEQAAAGKVTSAKVLADLVARVGGSGEDEAEGLEWEQLSPAQRAAARAQLMRSVEEAGESPATGEDA